MGNFKILIKIVFFYFLFSCSEKEPEEPKPAEHPIVGEWKAQYRKEGIFTFPQMEPAFPTNFSQNYPYQDEILLNFQPDMIFKESLANSNAPSGYFSKTYIYALDGNKVIFSNFDSTSNFFPSGKIYIDSLTENRLVIRDTVVNRMFKSVQVRIITATKK